MEKQDVGGATHAGDSSGASDGVPNGTANAEQVSSSKTEPVLSSPSESVKKVLTVEVIPEEDSEEANQVSREGKWI